MILERYGDKMYRHLFDGHSCVHKVKISQGKVVYSNKLLESVSYLRSCSENRLYPAFGTADLCSNIFNRVKTVFHGDPTMDNTNVTILPFAGEHL